MAKKLERYIIGDSIGRGAMGEVFKAYDTQTERDVAIKMLPAHNLQGEYLKRFKLEARTVARLEHAFIVPLYDFSLPEGDDPPFLVMRYMTGGTLAEKIRKGPMPGDEVYQITRRIASALDAAHERGLVHRDLKPGNILLDQNEYAYLADFGIVKDTKADESLTRGAQVGTSLYMSPEQIVGDELDHRSDIYALGVVVFEMLAGRPPFTGNMHTIFQGHLVEEIPRVYSFVDGVPFEVDDVLRKAMAKKPQDRYARASQMAKALEAALQSPSTFERVQHDLAEAAEDFEFKPLPEPDEDVPDTVRSATLPETVKSPQARYWQLLAGGLGLILVLVLGILGFNWLNRPDVTLTPDQTTVQTISLQASPSPPSPIPDMILVLQTDSSAVWKNGDTLEQLPENGRIPFRNPILVQSGQGRIELLLPNFVRIILDANTTLRVETAENDEGDSVLELQKGRILVKSDTPVQIYHQEGFQADLIVGTIGIEVNQTATVWQVDCLTGMCRLSQEEKEDQEGQQADPVELIQGQSAKLSEDGDAEPMNTQLARIATYNSLDASIILPTATSTASPTVTASATATPPATSTPTSTLDPEFLGPETVVLGSSAGGKDIEVVRFGNGPEVVLLVGGIHYGYAPNTVVLAQGLIDYFEDNLTAVPPEVTLYIVPNLSPDTPVSAGTVTGRLNAHGVDINRNWDCRWEPNPEILSQVVEDGGGTAVFSEPETQLLKTFIEENEPEAVLFWGARRNTVGLVAPGACEERSLVSASLVHYYAIPTGYEFIPRPEVLADNTLAGDVSNWLDSQGIPAIFVLLPGFLEVNFERELAGVNSL
ncbi:MAG: protein kinase, partial [Anaerolineales bacterium]|nr:protein kinase [Anaerolineales bacterium]